MKKRFITVFAVMAALLFLATPLSAAPSYYDGIYTNVLLKGYLSGQKGATLDNLTTSYWKATLPAAGVFQVQTGNFQVGNGTPTVSLNGEDAYIEGTFEVDGAVRFDNATLTLRGIAYTLPAADGAASQYLQTNGSAALTWAAGTSGTLDDAYNAGISITADAGAVAITNNAANNTGLLTLSKSPAGAQSGDILTITGGANGAGDMLQFANSGTGYDIAGTGGTWYVTKAGAATFASGAFTSVTTTNWYQQAIISAAAGNQALTVDAAGNGTITVGGTSTGNTIFPGVVAFNGNATIGNAATDTLAITSIVNADVTLDDGTGASPSLIFKDATDETATFSKADAGVLSLTTDATDGLNILTGNLWVGNGAPGTAAMNGEDAYIEGQLEVDGAVQFDGAVTAAGGATISGAASAINHNSNFTTGIGTGTTTAAVSIGGGSNTVAVNSSDWDISATGQVTGIASIAMDAAAASITTATGGVGQDLTVGITGATDSSLILSSTGTGVDALQITASAGGIDISGAAGGDIDILSTGKSVNITATEAAADQITLNAQGVIAGNAVNINTTDGGIVLTAGGAANGDMTLTVGDDLAINATGTAVITSSDWGISTTGVVTNIASVGFDSGTVIYHNTVSCDNACIKGLVAAPKQLIAAPGANKFIELVSAVLILNYGSEVLTESVDDMVIEYNTSGADLTAAIEATGFIDAAADTIKIVQPSAAVTVSAANSVNKAVQLFNSGDGEYGGNVTADTVMTIKVAYRIHPDGL